MPIITDACLIVEDLSPALEFYRDRVGFQLRRHAPGFADFASQGVTLALWERLHLQQHVGIDATRLPASGRATMMAIEVASVGEVDQQHVQLTRRGIDFLQPPKWYPWNAYACYFEDLDGHLWEIYTWGEGGHAGLIP